MVLSSNMFHDWNSPQQADDWPSSSCPRDSKEENEITDIAFTIGSDRRILELKETLKDGIAIVFLQNYDLTLAKLITAGVDLWLSTPQPPLEASREDESSGLRDAASLYDKLDRVINPMFRNDRDRFVEVMRHAIAVNRSFFNTQRMLQQYVLSSTSAEALMRWRAVLRLVVLVPLVIRVIGASQYTRGYEFTFCCRNHLCGPLGW
jgi:hypothetical protein